MEILIGREPEQGRLLVSVKVNGQARIAAIGGAGSVPGSVSRCLPAEGKAHCKIEVAADGGMVVTNLKAANVTYVDGLEVMSKRVTGESRVELGKGKYVVNVNTVVEVARKLAAVGSAQQAGGGSAGKEAPEFSILPLKRVWDRYHDEQFELQKRQKNLGLIKSLYIPCTLLSSLAGMLVRHLGMAEGAAQSVSYVLYGVAAVILFYGLYRSFTDRSLEEKEEIAERFEHDYVCPNPECHRFLNYQKYDILRQNKNCPFCKCRWTEK